MALKNFAVGENCVVSELAGMKTTFFAIFDPTWTHILTRKSLNMEFRRQSFNFQSLRKTEATLLPSIKT